MLLKMDEFNNQADYVQMNRFGLCNFCYNIYFVIKSTELFTNANSIENANSDVRYMPASLFTRFVLV